MRLALAVAFLLPSLAQAQSHIPAIKASVDDVYLRVGSRSVDKMHEILCTVEHYEGDWAWIHTGDGKEGWVKRSEVVPLERAIDYFTQRIREEPRQSLWYHKRATVWTQRGELDLALGDITEAIRLKPKDAPLRNNRGLIYHQKKDYDRALSDFNEAIRLEPSEAFYWSNAGDARAEKGELDKAIENYTRAIALDPKFPNAHGGRGWAWDQKKNYERAIADYNEAIRLDPRDAHSYNARAWLLATCPDKKCRDGKLAVQSAKKACELTDWKVWNNLDTFAAAYAEAGDFRNAVKYGEQALSMVPAKEKPAARKRLEGYKAGNPYRE